MTGLSPAFVAVTLAAFAIYGAVAGWLRGLFAAGLQMLAVKLPAVEA